MDKKYRVVKHGWRNEDTGDVGYTYYVEELVSRRPFLIFGRKRLVWRPVEKEIGGSMSGDIFWTPVTFRNEEEAISYMENLKKEIEADTVVKEI